MENPTTKNEKFVKHISNGKKRLIKTKNISFNSQDNLNVHQHSNKLNNNNEILVNKVKKYNENYKSERYEPKIIKLKLPGEAGHSKKVIDYTIMNPKNKRNIKISSIPEIKEENSIYSIYKENYENKKNLEELINNITNNIKKNNTFRNKDSISNNSMKIISYGQNDKYKNLLLNESSYYKKKPFYVLDKNNGNAHGNIYYKKNTSKNKNDDNTSEKNSKNSTPFKHKIIKNKTIVKKKRFHLNSLNNNKTEKTLVDLNKRNNYNFNPINLNFSNNDVNETNDNGVIMTTNNKNLYTKKGRNKYQFGYSYKKKDFETENEENNENNIQQTMKKKIIEYKKGKEKYESNNKNYKKEKENNNLKQLYKKIEFEKTDILKNINSNMENNLEKRKRNNKEGRGINKINHSFDRQSFKFLVHQTNKNRELSLSFSKYYKTRKDSFISTNYRVLSNDSSVSYSNINNDTDINVEKELNKPLNMYYSRIMNNNKKYKLENGKRQIKLDNFQSMGRIIKNRKINDDDEKDDNENSEINTMNTDEKNKTKENTIKKNKTMFLAGNSKKMNNNNLFIQTNLEKDSTNINDNEDNINNNNNRNQFKFNSFIKKRAKIKMGNNKKFGSLKEFRDNMSFHSTRIKNKISSSISINLELLYSLENKLRIIIEKIKKYEKCPDDVNYYINYYFMNKIYKEELKIFKDKNNKEYMNNYIKMEILCLFINYYISLGEGDNYKQTEILMKTIFEIIYNNLLLFLSLAISSEFNENKNDNIIVVLNKIIKDNIDKDYLIENGLFIDTYIFLDEVQYIEIILQSYKSIKNYYKMIINNIYINYISKNKIDNIEKLTVNEIIDLMNDKCELEEIMPIFFVESFKSLKDIKIDFFQKFFYFYFNNNNSINNEEYSHKSKSYKNMNTVIDNINYNINDNYNKIDENDNDEIKIDDSDNNNDINNNKNENNDESMSFKKIIYKNETPLTLPLPSYSSKYTLILDLDETLIYSQRNISYKLKKKENINKKRIILRPGLREFLKEMKKIFELIIFSSGTADYVNPIVEIIENDEKFFDFVLYRNHITLDEDGNNVKNLDLIGRNIKKIIIIDDIPRYFKLQKDNGINIKPFLGNISSDKNTLKTLSYILKKIRIDAEETNDIRISLKKFKHMLYPDVINSME